MSEDKKPTGWDKTKKKLNFFTKFQYVLVLLVGLALSWFAFRMMASPLIFNQASDSNMGAAIGSVGGALSIIATIAICFNNRWRNQAHSESTADAQESADSSQNQTPPAAEPSSQPAQAASPEHQAVLAAIADLASKMERDNAATNRRVDDISRRMPAQPPAQHRNFRQGHTDIQPAMGHPHQGNAPQQGGYGNHPQGPAGNQPQGVYGGQRPQPTSRNGGPRHGAP